MELKDFKCCNSCGRLDNCPAPCPRFLNSVEMDNIDKKFAHDFKIDEEYMKKKALKAQVGFSTMKKNALKKTKINKKIKFRSGTVKDQGNIIQVTDVFMVLKCAKYIKNINFRDIFTKDIILE